MQKGAICGADYVSFDTAVVRSRAVRGRPRTPVVRWPALAFGLVLALTLPASGSAGPGATLLQRAAGLRGENSTLAARSSSALLGLYSLDARLSRAGAEVTALDAQVARLGQQRDELRLRARIVRHALTISEQRLAFRLRQLYEQDQADPLAIILGASSLDEVMTGIDGLQRTARADQSIVVAARAQRRTLVGLTRRLAAREASLQAARAEAAARATALQQAEAERRSYLASLAAKQQLNRAQIGSLEQQAGAIAARAQVLTSARAAAQPFPTATTPAAAPTVSPVAPPAGEHQMTVVATGYALRGRTSTGAPTGPGIVAVDPGVIPLGSHLSIPGYGEGVAADTGPGVQGASIDLWFASEAQALSWGRRTVTITVR
ncbi:MAG: hypothetical protein QOE36_493 [Gaiellaceae bacterium]|nr:hypothetical protein [Gaiellaceae bacterium]